MPRCSFCRFAMAPGTLLTCDLVPSGDSALHLAHCAATFGHGLPSGCQNDECSPLRCAPATPGKLLLLEPHLTFLNSGEGPCVEKCEERG